MTLPVLALLIAAQQSVVIRDVTLIDGTGAPPRPHVTVVTTGDRIVTVATPAPGATAALRVPIPRGATVIDGGGKFLLPGFVDAHAHVAFGPVHLDRSKGTIAMRLEYDPAASREMLSTLLAFGVTAVRNPAGPTEQAVAMRDSVERGQILGPRIRTAGEVIDINSTPNLGVRATSEAEVRAEVDRQAAAGVDWIKVYIGLGPALVKAAVDEGHLKGRRVMGHLLFTSWTDAANDGIDAITHIIPGSPQLIPAARRAEYLKSITGTQFMATWFKYVDLESPEIHQLTEALVRHHVVLDFTLVAFEAMFRGDDQAIIASRDLVYAPPSLLDNWRNEMTLSLGWSADDFRMAQAVWPNVLAFARHLYDAGVKLAVGTDVPNPWVAPGISFHREMQLLVDAGIPPATVLVMATRNGAELIGLGDEIGTVVRGKRADLVLLGADPIVDIRNTQRIERVLRGGKLLTPAELLPPRVRDASAQAH